MIEQQKKKFKEVLEKTEEIKNFHEENIKELKDILDFMDKDLAVKESDNVDTIILKKYIEYGSMKEVQKYINDLGYRIKTDSYVGSRKYTIEDISQVVYPYQRYEDEEQRVINADEEFKEMAKKIHLYIYNSSYGKLRVKEFNK